MSEFEYVFALRGPIPEEFSAQREELTELVLELGGRKLLPKTWKLVDWLRARPKAAPEVLEQRRRHRTVLGLLTLLLSLFALGPAMIAPKELLSVLLAGAACLGAGIVSLWKCHRILLAILLILAGLFYGVAGFGGEEFRSLLILGVMLFAVAVVALLSRRKKHNRAAMKDIVALFERRSSILEDQPIHIRFTPHGVQAMTQEKQSEFWPYDTISGILETMDLLVVVLDKQGFLLAKSELIDGVFPDFKTDLSARVLWLTKKGIS